MPKVQAIKILYIALAIEAGLGLFFMLRSGAWVSLLVIIMIYALLGGGAFLLKRLGLGQTGWLTEFGSNWKPVSPPAAKNWSESMKGINLATGPERSEVINFNLSLEEGISALQINVGHGNLRVVGQEGLNAVLIVATKRVFAREEYTARNELDRLQIRSWREGTLLKVEAGPADGLTNFTIGRSARIDLDITAPPALAAAFSSAAGDLIVRDYQGELSARTGSGTMIIERYNCGRNLDLSSGAGRITLQQVAAGTIRTRTGAGTIELTGVGAETLELGSAAGMIRARSINCAHYTARAQLGSVDLYDARIEQELELSATAGQVHVENATTNSFRLESTTGMIFYRGTPPLYNSYAKSTLGAIELLLVSGGTFNLDLRSSVGTVNLGLPISTTYNSTRNAFSGVVGAGGPQLQVQTQVGNIRVAQV
ncbi:MAG: DUF4097 family beta strand repeat-containing protein [Chloroflexota bacterium]